MKSTRHIALAAAAVIGFSSLVSPGLAVSGQKKQKEASQPSLKLGKEFQVAALAAQAALQANDNAKAETELVKADALAKEPDELYFAATLRLPLEARKKNNEGILKALDVLIVHPRTQPADVARYTYVKGTTLLDLKRPAEALPVLLKARELGFQDPNMGINIVNAQFQTGNAAGGAQEMDALIKAEEAAGRKAPDNWYSFVIARLYNAKDVAGATSWTKRALAIYPTKENWERLLFFTRQGKTFPRNERIALYRLQHSVNAITTEGDYFDYATATSDAGLPWESLRIITEARSKGVIKGAAGSFNALETTTKTRLGAEQPIATYERQAIASANGASAAQTGDAYQAEGNFAKAIEMYNLALKKGVANANVVNLNLGSALVRAGRKEEAKAALAKVQGGTAAEVAGLWNVVAAQP